MDSKELLHRDRTGEKGVETYIYDHAARGHIRSISYTKYTESYDQVTVGVMVRTQGGDQYSAMVVLTYRRFEALKEVMDRCKGEPPS